MPSAVCERGELRLTRTLKLLSKRWVTRSRGHVGEAEKTALGQVGDLRGERKLKGQAGYHRMFIEDE